MELIVFAGPSLGGFEPADWPGIDFRPPAACGDIARVIIGAPRAIGLIDGFFETSASPWHKEILWGLSRGVAMFGAASLGALRAAELAPFGMRGVGQVFEACRKGILEDDAEVAVLHGPAETGYLPLTEAMVNVRASLGRARRAGILGRDEELVFTEAASAIFYKDRTWPRIIEHVARLGADRAAIAKLSDWVAQNPVDVKREDALELLALLSSADLGSPKGDEKFEFVDTSYFVELRQRLGVAMPRGRAAASGE
jgi:hypothetical protein